MHDTLIRACSFIYTILHLVAKLSLIRFKKLVNLVSTYSLLYVGRLVSGAVLSSCHSLYKGTWSTEPSMQERRSHAGASSYKTGLLITGGANTGGLLSSTELLNSGQWTCGQQLPRQLSRHCQVQYADTVIIAGKKTVYNVFD